VHRINNVAGAIRAYVQQIRAMQDQGRLTNDYLDRKLGGIIENAERALEMARRICTPFQFQPADTEPIDVKQMIVAALQELDIPPTIQVQRQLAPSLPQVKATGQLQEVFRNLIKNAWEAMGDQGALTIRTWHSEDRKYAMASVADTGPGIEASQHEEIFRLGFGSKEGKGHLGYGLWWTRTFLKRLGGEIHLESQVGQGSTFTIVLPVVQVPGRDGKDGG
jgi:signal transduction histidine kinase